MVGGRQCCDVPAEIWSQLGLGSHVLGSFMEFSVPTLVWDPKILSLSELPSVLLRGIGTQPELNSSLSFAKTWKKF